jgi:hypothetical protein
MRLSGLFSVLLLGLSNLIQVSATDNGKTTDVTWDKYSLSVKGERVFIYSGEFHYQRLPVPELWLDVFQKLRSNGFNAVSSMSTLTNTPHSSQDIANLNPQSISSGASTPPRKMSLTLKTAPTISSASSTTQNKPVYTS